MKPGSVFRFSASISTGYEVPFDENAYILIFKGRRTTQVEKDFIGYLQGMAANLQRQHKAGGPLLLKELSVDHPGRKFAAEVSSKWRCEKGGDSTSLSSHNPAHERIAEAFAACLDATGEAMLELRRALDAHAQVVPAETAGQSHHYFSRCFFRSRFLQSNASRSSAVREIIDQGSQWASGIVISPLRAHGS